MRGGRGGEEGVLRKAFGETQKQGHTLKRGILYKTTV